MRRRDFVGLLVAQAGCIRTPPKPALARAAEYLWQRQDADGGWHSRTYGLLRSGQSLTPFVLDALLQVPETVLAPRPARIAQAVAFLNRNARPDGVLGMADPDIPDFPNYSTALAVSALCRARRPGWEEQTARMVAALKAQQFTEQNGWTPAHAAYGAWGMGGARRTPPYTGHVDLSMTRHVLQALRAAGVPAADPAFTRAAVFLDRCRAADGGFFFTTTEPDTNKAGSDGKQFRSYGSTTADGILASLAAGARPADESVAAARQWIAARHRSLEVPGFAGEAYHRWPRGLAFYYAAAVSQAFQELGASPGDALAGALKSTQRSDGSWANAENLVKEDDPLIATPFAVRALLRAEL